MLISIIPQPAHIGVLSTDDRFVLDCDTPIVVGAGCERLAHVLNGFVKQYLSTSLPERPTIEPGAGIVLEIDPALTSLGEEGYRFVVSQEAVVLSASSDHGLYYALQSLRQLIYQYRQGERSLLPLLEIEDRPRFAYRGFMLDVGRHFFDADAVKRLIDLAALHKLNRFHWHLTEDQGWRIEIGKYPKLIEVGSQRSETLGDGTAHGGYFTQDEIRDVVAYAAERFVTIVPELDVPGHFMSAIAAYPRLGCTGERQEVSTRFGIRKDIACAGKESTYSFLFDVLDEIAALFPGPVIHLGGDEAPKARWKVCPDCQSTISREGLVDEEALQGYFLDRLVQHLKAKGKTAMVWNDGVLSQALDTSVIVQHWMERGKPAKTVPAINAGHKAVISDFFHLYLDYPYGMTRLRKVYGYDPILKGVAPEHVDNIVGVESPLWTELVADRGRLDYQVFPRLAATAEMGWTPDGQKDYGDFKMRLATFTELLADAGVAAASLDEVDPGFLKGIGQVLGHMGKLFDWETVKELFG